MRQAVDCCDQGHKVGDGDDASSRVGPGDN